MYTIQQLCKRFNTTPRTLRYYEQRGVTERIERVNGLRKYRDADVDRFDVAFHLRHYDVSIDDIADLLNSDISNFSAIYDGILRDSQERLTYEIAHKENALYDLEGEMASRGIK